MCLAHMGIIPSEGASVKSGIYVGAFSESVQAYLRASGYTQKELADALGLHPKVLSRKLHGSGNARLTHLEVQRIIKTLARWHTITTQDEALGLLELAHLGPSLFSAEEWRTPPLSVLVSKRAHPASSGDSGTRTPSFQHNLPAPTTRLIGREWALVQLRQLLARDDVRLVTLVGTGGSGKTRLALQVANELLAAFAQGVWFVSLAGVSDPALVPMSIIQALNIQPAPSVPPLQSLITYLKNRHLLLLLDNFEQVGEAAAIVDALLAGSAGLKVLVTSRVVLRLYGEHEFRVLPLDVPNTRSTLETLEVACYGAVQLFVERAQAVLPDFALSPENAAVIAQICARMDGLPLALELAAARVKVLPPALLLERLTAARLRVLTGGARNLPRRQQTLRKTITWSYDLLSATEQAWFRRLGVFSGSWSLEAAEAMMQDETADLTDAVSDSPLDMLERLVDNSLLVRLPFADEEARFTMLETLREYALEQLSAQGESERLRDWHAGYYLREAEAGEQGLRGPQQLTWLTRLTADRANFRAALEWSLQQARDGGRIQALSISCKDALAGVQGEGLPAVEVCQRLAAALRPYLEWQGSLTEARHWLGAALEVPLEDGSGETVLAARAKALSEDSRLVCLQNNQPRAVELAEESIALWRRLDDPSGLATALLHRGWVAQAIGENETAKCVYQEAMQYLSVKDNPWLRAQLLFYLGAAAGFTGDFEQMHALYKQSRELFAQVGDTSAVADVWKDQGGMSLLQGNSTESIACLLKSLKLCCDLDHKQYITTGMCLLSLALGMRGEPDAVTASLYSAQVRGIADNLMDTIGLSPWTETNPFVQMIQEQIRSRVDEESWQTAWSTGHALTIAQAIELSCRLGEEVLP